MAFGIKTVGGGNVNFDVVPTSSNTVVTIDNVSGIPVYGNSVTGALILPSGTTAQRTTSPTVGAIRQNLTLGIIEIWNGYNWGDITGKLPSTYRTQKSLRFRAAGSAYLSKTFATAGNRSVWTWSTWIKRGKLGAKQNILSGFPNSTTYALIEFTAGDSLRYGSTNSGGDLITTQVFRDPSMWYHIVVAYDDTQSTASNRLKFYVNGVQVTSFSSTTYPPQNFGGYINSAYSHYIGQDGLGNEYNDCYRTEVNFIDGQALDSSYFGEVDVVSGSWIPKPYTGTYGQNGFYLDFSDNTSTTTLGYNKAIVDYEANAFTDVFSTVTKTNNNDGTWRWVFGNATTVMRLGSLSTITGTVTFTFRVKLVSGTVSTFPIDYGDGTSVDIKNDLIAGQWVTVTKTLTAGTQAWMDFPSNVNLNGVTLDVDYVSLSGQNNWTTNNISLTAGVTYDSMLDVPTLTSATVANYATLNPLDYGGNSFPITNGNLTWSSTTTGAGFIRGTIGMTSGKWYWEIFATRVSGGTCGVGIAKNNSSNFSTGQVMYQSDSGQKIIDGTSSAYGATWATNNVIGIAYDADVGQITFFKDNASQGAITLSGYAGVNVCPVVADGSSLSFDLDVNFGQRPFTYTPPTGFKALNAYNLP